MEWKLSDERRKEYDTIMSNAQDLDATIGSTYYRVHKLVIAKEDLERFTKEWWDKLITEMNLEKSSDYMITRDGTVKLIKSRNVDKPNIAPESKVGTNAAELK